MMLFCHCNQPLAPVPLGPGLARPHALQLLLAGIKALGPKCGTISVSHAMQGHSLEAI